MAAADRIGDTCGFLPTRPLIAIVAFLWLLVGLWHVAVVGSALGGAALESTSDFGLSPSCQGSACHAEWREQFFTCAGGYQASFRMRYLIVGIFGTLFGYLGFQGVLSRDYNSIKGFMWFSVAMIVLFVSVLIWDQFYVLMCDVLPLNMQKDVELFVPTSMRMMLRAQGYKSLAGIKAEKIRRLMGYDYNTVYVAGWIAIWLVSAFMIKETRELVNATRGGPVGLGPSYIISGDPNREVHVMYQRLQDVFEDSAKAPRCYPSLPTLQAGNSFPYINRQGPGASINYGSLGCEQKEEAFKI